VTSSSMVIIKDHVYKDQVFLIHPSAFSTYPTKMRLKGATIICPYCGNSFRPMIYIKEDEVYNDYQRFCSRVCKKLWGIEQEESLNDRQDEFWKDGRDQFNELTEIIRRG